MTSNAFCPISPNKINERVARLNGAFTVLLLIVFSLTRHLLPLIILWVDFLIRAADGGKYSPLAFLSRSAVSYFKLGNVMINAGPKLFAARIGFVFTSLIILFFVFGYSIVTFSLTGILGLFSFLEAALGLCVACEIYPFIYRILYKSSFQQT
ncbi:MAG: DUF4395 domain-containing protein [Bacteroidota bacterium]